jgi:hypothetical protein
MPNYIVKDEYIHFRQSFPRPVLCKLFPTLFQLVNIEDIKDTGSKVYPYSVKMSESEFLYVLELAGVE